MKKCILYVILIFAFLSEVNGQAARENFKFAKFKFDNKEYKNALDFLNKAVYEDSLYVNAYYLRAATQYELQNYFHALMDIEKVFELEDEDVSSIGEYYLLRGKIYLGIEEYDQALVDLNRAISDLEDNGDPYYYRGKLYNITGKKLKALSDLDHAIMVNPDKAHYYGYRAEIKIGYLNPVYGDEKYQSTLADINVAIALDPENKYYYRVRGEYLKNMGQQSEALTDYNVVIKEANEEDLPYLQRGVIKMNKYEYRSAIDDFSKSIESDPDNPNSYRYRALCFHNINMYREAYRDFSKSIDLLTSELTSTKDADTQVLLAETFLLRGHCANLMGNSSGACRDFLRGYNLGDKKGLNFYRRNCGIY